MPTQEGGILSSSMKDVMSAVNSFALLSYYGSLAQNMEESQSLRKRELARLEAEDKRQLMMQDFTVAEHVSKNPQAFSLEFRVKTLNDLTAKHGLKPTTVEAARAFEGQVEAFKKHLSTLPTSVERRAAYANLQAEAAPNPFYNQTLDAHKYELEDLVEQPAFENVLSMTGLSPEAQAAAKVQLRPGVGMKLFQDKSYRDMAVVTDAQNVLARVYAGKEVADGEVRDALARAAAAGVPLHPDFKDMMKGHLGSQEYSRNIASLSSTRDQIASLSDAVKQVNYGDLMMHRLSTRQAIADAARTRSLADIDESVVGNTQQQAFLDALPKTLPPDQVRSIQATISTLPQQLAQLDKRRADFDNKVKVVKLAGNLNPAEQELLEQEVRLTHQHLDAQREPLQRLSTFLTDPTKKNWQAVVEAPKALDQTIHAWERERAKLYTMAEQKEQFLIEKERSEHQTKQATNEFGQRFMAVTGEHPELYDEDGTLDVPKAGRLMSPIAQELSAKYKVQLDADDVLAKFATAGKRSVPRQDTLEKLTPEQSVRFGQMVTGLEGIQHYRREVQLKDGGFDRAKLFTQSIRLPYSDGRTVDTIILEAGEGKIRLESGAAVPDTEIARLAKRAIPLFADSDATIETKLRQLERFYQVQLEVMDPKSILRKRVSPSRPVTPMERAGAGLSAEGFVEFSRTHPDLPLPEALKLYKKGGQ
jgi:hypothetical protein